MVNVMLNRIARILYNVKQETAQREKYYELIMDFVETGIVVLNSKGSVYQKNKEAMNLLGLDVLTHVKQLSRISDELMTALEKAVRVTSCKFSSIRNGERYILPYGCPASVSKTRNSALLP